MPDTAIALRDRRCRRPGRSRKPPRSAARMAASGKRRRRCSRPATAPPACRISARSARSRAPPGCATPITELTGLPVPPAGVQRRHGRAAQGAGQRAEPGHAGARYLGQPLTRIPDPFGTHESFGAHNNARLRAFLDSFGFEYEFASATDYYAAGRFDAALLRVLERHDEIVAVILPTLGPERRATYSPFLPIHPRTGLVMQVPIERVDPAAGTRDLADPESGERFETPVTGGACKLQWKADWAMRWHALGVDYEMSGKDLIDSVRLSSRICRILGSKPPVGFTYELFLDEHGQKISKTKGNGLSVEEWLRYAPPESLAQFMYNAAAARQAAVFRRDPARGGRILANAAQAAGRRTPRARRPTRPGTSMAAACRTTRQPGLVRHAAEPGQRGERRDAGDAVGLHPPLQPGRDARRRCRSSTGWSTTRSPTTGTSCARQKHFRAPDAIGARGAGRPRRDAARHCPPDADAEAIQNVVYEVGKRHPFPSCGPGSAACIRCCSASRRARASAASSRCTASPRPSR